MGRLFKVANAEATEVIWFGDESEGDDRDWVRVRSSITSGEAHQLFQHAPTGDTRNLRDVFSFIEYIFEKVVVAWSFVDEEGNEIKPTLESFRLMDASGATLIENRLGQHFGKLTGREVEQTEGESTT